MRIRYLSGCYGRNILEQLLTRKDLGIMTTPMIGNKVDLTTITWAADTGCFATPEKYDSDNYLRWLEERLYAREQCLLVTAPDVFGDGPATLEKAMPVLPRIRDVGFPAALVIQPGITKDDLDWESFDALFFGGPDDWRASEPYFEIVREGHRQGKYMHLGRVNSRKRIRHAADELGVHSVDGTMIGFGPKRHLPSLKKWMDEINSYSVEPKLRKEAFMGE